MRSLRHTFDSMRPTLMTGILFTFLAVFGGLSASHGLAKGFGAAPKLGDKAPAFALSGLDGQRVTLSGELAHGPVVLVLLRGWPGYQCPFCTKQFADFLSHASDFDASGARVVWVYPGPADQVRQRAQEFTASRPMPASFRVAPDPDYVFTNAYGLRWDAPGETAYPSTFVVDKTGIVRFAQISPAHDARAKADDVLKALMALSH
jgi:peroxiredoxin